MYFVQSHLLPDVYIFYKNDYTYKELAYTQSFKDTFDIKNVLSGTPQFAKNQQKVIENIRVIYFIETNHSDVCEMGSTDVGDVPGVFVLHKLILHVIPLVQVHIAVNGLHKVRAVLHIKAVCLQVMYCLMPQKHCIKILK